MSKIGDKRQFSFIKEVCIIEEILEDAGISMWWTWKTEICPHCKETIEKRILHEFNKVEILSRQNVPVTKKTDLVLLGHSKDGKLLQLTIDKFDEVLSKSEKYKELVGE